MSNRYRIYRNLKGGETVISDFGALLSFTLQAFSVEFTIYGFTFSFWQVFLFSAVSAIVGRILWEVFFGD